MLEHFSVSLSKNPTDARINPSAVSAQADQDTSASFEKELNAANDVTNQDEEKMLVEMEEKLNLGLSSSQLIQQILGGQFNLGDSQFFNQNTNKEVSVQKISNTDNSEQAEADNIPQSLVEAAKNANKKFFSEVVDFKQLFAAQFKNNVLAKQEIQSIFTFPKISFEELFDTIVQKVEFLKEKGGGISHLRLDLKPENLGHLKVLLSLQDNNIVIHVLANEDAKKMLDTDAHELVAALEKAGLSVGHLEVEISDQRFSSKKEQEYFSLTNGKKVPCGNYDLLKIVDQVDIIKSVNNWLADVMINYIA